MSKSWHLWTTNWSTSTKLPLSISLSSLSLAVSLPALCCFSMASVPPPIFAFSFSSFSSFILSDKDGAAILDPSLNYHQPVAHVDELARLHADLLDLSALG